MAEVVEGYALNVGSAAGTAPLVADRVLVRRVVRAGGEQPAVGLARGAVVADVLVEQFFETGGPR